MATPHTTQDSLLILKDAGLVAADAAATVSAAAQVLDLGEGSAAFCGTVVIDATAVEVATGDEVYKIQAQFSNSATFASGVVNGATMILGDAAVIVGADTDNGAGRYLLPVVNDVGGTRYRYMRLYTDVTGTIATGINYSAYLGKPGVI